MNLIYKGDCLDVLSKLPEKCVDTIICDLPYNTTRCSWDSPIDLEALWKQYKRITKPGSPIILFSQQPFSSLLVTSNISWFKYNLIWDKTFGRGHLVAKFRPMQQTEDILVFGKGRVKYNPIKSLRDKPVMSKEAKRTEIMGGTKNKEHVGKLLYDKNPTNLITFRPVSRGRHPCQKPLELLEYLVKTYSDEEDVILDNCFGSGSTLIAANNTNRKFIGIEKDSNYFNGFLCEDPSVEVRREFSYD